MIKLNTQNYLFDDIIRRVENNVLHGAWRDFFDNVIDDVWHHVSENVREKVVYEVDKNDVWRCIWINISGQISATTQNYYDRIEHTKHHT
jgi:hypothetical protein